MSEFTEAPDLPPPPPALEPIPWERPGAGMGDFFPTLKLFISNPDAAFGRLPASNAVGRALIFGLVIHVISNAIALLWNLLMGQSVQALLDRLGGMEGMDVPHLSPGVLYLIQLAVAPVLYVVGALIVSGIIHLMLLMLGGGPGGFTTTFRVYCYATVAALASMIPFVGGLLTLGWWLVLIILGLKAAHRIPTGRSVAAVLIPVGLCCVCAVVLGVVFFTAIAAAFGAAGH